MEHPASSSLNRIPRLITPRYVLIGLVVAGLSAVVLFPRILMLLGLPDYGHWFLDSYAVLAANDAVRAGMNPYAANPLDALMRSHVYSDWWLLLGRLGLTREHNFYFGGVCVLGFLIIALIANKPRSYVEALCTAALLLSPPMLLAINRANNDLIIFILLGSGLMPQRSNGGGWARAWLGLMIVLGTGLKYYPVVGVLVFALIGRPLRHWLGTGLLTVLAAMAVLWLERTEIVRAMFRLPGSLYVFGARVWWSNWNMEGEWLTLANLLLLATGALFLAWRGWTKGLADGPPETFRARLTFALGALLLAGCFLIGSSYAYRWIFALWLWPWLSLQIRTGSRAACWSLAFLVVALWGDGAYCFVTNIRWIALQPTGEMFCLQAMQASHWLLMALLTGWLMEALVAAVRALRKPTDRPGNSVTA
ncbi:MAG: DUF2029 domain-containing protein [Opitutae bacterium]|nr:DUF2029 domain-containing protein [Opitutae bacterium]